MRAIVAAVLTVGLGGFAAAEDKADPVGTWKCETDVKGQKRESTLTVKKDGDKLTGTVTGQDKKELKANDVKFKDGTLTYSVDRELMEQKFTVKYTLKIDGDALKGKAEADLGGEAVSFDITGKREKGEAKKDK